jgi:hypothetical protein
LTPRRPVGIVADPSGGIASKTASAIAKKSLENVIDSWLAEPSLQSAYETLRTRLTAKGEGEGERLLVVIDDIDRLDPSEIRSIMQMVKSVGRLPNIIYLLAYDRKIIWSALDANASQGDGQPSFAEKIVQQELELPQPTRSALLRILDDEICFLSGGTPDTRRWYNLVQSGIHQWIRYPRDVLRLSNAVKFAWPALENEIDPQDLLCMEGLRIFDQPLFDWIRRNRDFLLAQGRFRIASDEVKAAVGEDLKNSLASETRQDQLEVLCTLFPTLARIIQRRRIFDCEQYNETVKRRGIASKAGYDAYFSLFPSPNAVPKTIIDNAIRDLDDESAQLGFFLDFLDRRDESGAPLISDYLEELEFRFRGQGAAQPTQSLLSLMHSLMSATIFCGSTGTAAFCHHGIIFPL